MSKTCHLPHPLQREGTYRWERMAPALKAGYYLPDDRSPEKLLAQMAEMASAVRYYDATGNEYGRWEEFFNLIYDYRLHRLRVENIEALADGNLPPHLGLLVSFVKTFQKLQDQYNEFPQRHLRFYYEEVLRLQKKVATPDRVCLLFELAKKAAPTKLPVGTLLLAGKDELKKELKYATTREIIVNDAAIAAVKSVYAASQAGVLKALYVGQDAWVDNATTQQGIASVRPFGSTQNAKADIGFAIASPMLFAKEGRRRISIEVNTSANIPRSSLRALYTGPEGWQEAEVDIQPGINSSPSSTAKKFVLIKVATTLPAIVAYDAKVHGSGFDTAYPVIKLLLKNDNQWGTAYAFFTALKASDLKKMVVNVEGVSSFSLANDEGMLDPAKPFKPFGSQPVKNKSYLIMGHPEAFNEYLKTFHLAMNWKGAPGNLSKYYQSYAKYLSTSASAAISTDTKASFAKQWTHFDQGNVPGKVSLLKGGTWQQVKEDIPNRYIVKSPAHYNTFHVLQKINDKYVPGTSNQYAPNSSWGFAKVTCAYDFGHRIYPEVATHNLTQIALGETGYSIPPVPYTPEWSSLHLDYVLEDQLGGAASSHSIVQLHPFGNTTPLQAADPLLTTAYAQPGQLYLGISGVASPQIVNLFVARQEGSGDINADVDMPNSWQYLSGKHWVDFTAQQIVTDTTMRFTASGFIAFSLPQEAFLPHTIADSSLVWIRLQTPNAIAAYPNLMAIHTNAVEAVFVDNANDPSHLNAPLAAATISKMVSPIASIKKVTQPYNSYGGAPQEQEEAFNTRVSERLRHKNRAWSIWDYEHLLLEKFPGIYKVKTITHSTLEGSRAPGHVLCVALPATAALPNQEAALQPMLSKGLLTEAEAYLASLQSPFVQVKLCNPVYEPISIQCSVKVMPGYDETYYAQQLNTELQGFISPWLVDKSKSPSFEGRLYASALINFIEERPYIDYLTHFQALKLEEGVWKTWNESVSGSNESVILTSVSQHEIDTQASC